MPDLKKHAAEVVTFSASKNSLRSVIKLASLIYLKRPEIVPTHFVDYKTRFAIPYISGMMGVPKTLAMVHCMRIPKKSFFRKAVFNNYNRVLTVSDAARNYLMKEGVDPQIVSTHYLGLFGERERSEKKCHQIKENLGISNQSTVISCIAFDTPFKGLDILLNAIAKVYRKHPQIHLIIIGVDADNSTLSMQAKKLRRFNKAVVQPAFSLGVREKLWSQPNVR